MEPWLIGKIFVMLLLASFLLECLYLLRKLSRKTQQLLYLLLILVEWLSNGWLGLLVSLLWGIYFIASRKDQESSMSESITSEYGDGQESTENLMRK